MKTIELHEVARCKREAIQRIEENRPYSGNAAADQRRQYIENQSDIVFMNDYNEVATKENRRLAAITSKKAAVSAERKATGKSKKAYRAEYDALMKEYKTTGNIEAYRQAKSIAKYAF